MPAQDIVPIISPFNNPVWAVLKPDINECHFTVDYHLMPCYHPLRPAYLTLLKLIQSATGKYFAVIDLANMFCCVCSCTASQKQFAFTFEGTVHFHSPPHGICQQP